MPLNKVFGAGLFPILLLAASSIGGGIHMLASKKLVSQMDSVNLNLSTFFFSSFVTMIPSPMTFHFTGLINPWSLSSLLGLGFVKGISFYFYAEALRKVPFLALTIISNSCVLFTLIWSVLFFKEDVNGYVIAGAGVLLSGLVVNSIPKRIPVSEKQVALVTDC